MKENSYQTTYHESFLLNTNIFLKKNSKKILIGGIVGGMLGFGISLLLPSKYHATAYIQTGKVADIEVETTSALIAKLKVPTYYSHNTFTDCQVDNFADPGTNLIKHLSISQPRLTTLVVIRYEGRSTESVKTCLDSILADIRNNQNEIFISMLKNKRNLLDNLNLKLKAAEDITNNLASNKFNFDFNDSKFSAFMLLLSTTLNKESEVRELRIQITNLVESLSEPHTKSTYSAVPVHAAMEPVGPKRILITLSSGIVGGILVIFLLLGRKTWSHLLKPSATL